MNEFILHSENRINKYNHPSRCMVKNDLSKALYYNKIIIEKITLKFDKIENSKYYTLYLNNSFITQINIENKQEYDNDIIEVIENCCFTYYIHNPHIINVLIFDDKNLFSMKLKEWKFEVKIII